MGLTGRLGPDWLRLTLGAHVVGLGAHGRVAIRHGRASFDAQQSAAQLSVTVAADSLPALPSIGDPVRVELGPDSAAAFGLTGAALTAAAPRFVGTVTDLGLGLGPSLTSAGYLTVVAVGNDARLGRTFVGDTPWPDELDAARAGRILDLAAPVAGLTRLPDDPGRVTVLARDVDRQNALGLLDALSTSTGGRLFVSRAGGCAWHDREHRRDAPNRLTLTPDNVARDTRWTQRLPGLLNSLSVAYGLTPPGGQQSELTVADPASIAAHGPFAARVASVLRDQLDADAHARTLVGQRSTPAWEVTGLTVDLARTVTAEQARALLQLEAGELLSIEAFPVGGPHAATELYAEGWDELITAGDWRMALDVTAADRASLPPRWQDIPAHVTWADVPTDLTWLGAAAWFDY